MESIANVIDIKALFDNVWLGIILRILVFAIVIKGLHALIKFFTKGITSKIKNKEQVKQVRTVISMFKSVADTVISLIFIMELLTKLGIDIRPILTAAGVLGVAVGFGAKRFVEDLITGVMLILEGQIQVGDIIEVGTRMGTVEKLNLKMVVLRDFSGNVHYIRNGMIDIVTNYTRDFAYAVLEIGVAYKENIDNVMKVVIDVAQNELKNGEYGKYLLGDIEMLGLNSFGDSSVNVKFRIKTLPANQWEVAREFNRLIKNKFDELEIEIPFPQRTLHIEKENIMS